MPEPPGIGGCKKQGRVTVTFLLEGKLCGSGRGDYTYLTVGCGRIVQAVSGHMAYVVVLCLCCRVYQVQDGPRRSNSTGLVTAFWRGVLAARCSMSSPAGW